MERKKRRSLMWVLLVVLIALPFIIGFAGAGVGTPELGIWVVLFVAWLVAFFTWAKPNGHTHPAS